MRGEEHSSAGDKLGETLARVDPSVDGWDTEVASGRSNKQLHHMEELLADRSLLVEGELGELASDNFAGPSLLPVGEPTLFNSAGFDVRRYTLESDSERVHTGRAGCAMVLRELIAPFADDVPVEVHFKQFRIELDAESMKTRAYFEAVGEDKDGRPVQQSATCDFEWEYDGERALLLSITTQELELVEGRRDGHASYEDATRAIIGEDKNFAQLLRGVPELCQQYHGILGLELFGHHGVSVADFDGDGLDDLYFCQPGGLPNQLYIHQSDGSAIDRAAEFGVDFLDATRAALAVDLDGDGDQDLVLGLRKVQIFENTGARFELRKTVSAPANYAVSAADPDGDGDLDLYVCCYSYVGKPPTPYHDANDGVPNLLLRNDGDWQFPDATKEFGLDDDNVRHSFSASWSDYDEDGDIDLYVANDYGRNCLYRNTGGHFENVAPSAGVEDISAGMSVSWGDYDADGHMDLYVGNMFSSAGNRITYQRKFREGMASASLDDFRRHARGNSLFRNLGDGSFEDVSAESGTTMGRWSWSSSFVDINADGLQDIVVANGYLTNSDPDDL